MQDDPINAKVLQKRLQSDGHQVAHATNGQEATGVISADQEFDCGFNGQFSEHPLRHDARCIDKGHFRMPIKDAFQAIQAIRGPEAFNLLQFHFALTIYCRMPDVKGST